MSGFNESQLDQLLEAMYEPSLAGMLVTGGVGMGKTTLGTALASALAADFEVLWMTGRRLLAQTPLAILETFCPQLCAAGGESPEMGMNVVQALYEYLLSTSEAAGKSTLLVVDDAQWIDEQSCAALEQLAVSGEVRMLLLCQPGTSSVACSPLFTDDTMMAQHTLHTLSGPEVLASCEKRLEGQVVPGAAAILAELSGGHPLFLQVLLDAAVASQAFVAHRNIWTLATVPSTPDPVVCDVALDLFNDCTGPEQLILETVALAEPVSTGVLHRLVPGTDHGSLMAAGILRRTAEALDSVEFVSPVFGQSLRQRIPVGHSVQIRKNVLQARATLPLNSDALMRHAGWGIDCGQHVSARQLLHAARIANLRNKSRLALRLAATVSEPNRIFQARVESVIAHTKLRHFAHAWALIDTLLGQVRNVFECDAVAALTAMVAVKEGQPGKNLERLARMWREAYRGFGLQSCPGADIVDALLTVSSGYLLPAKTQDRLKDIAATQPHAGLQFAATALLANAEAIEGRHAAAQAHFLQARTLLQQNPGQLDMFRQAFFAQHTVSLASIGEAPQPPAPRREPSRARGSDRRALELGGLGELAAAMKDLRLGKVKAAVASFDVAVAALRESDPGGVLPYALAASAYACHLLGEHGRAEVLAEEFTAGTAADSAPIWLLSKAYVAAAHSQQAGEAATFARLDELCAQARRRGTPAMELAILDVLLRAGGTGQLQRMSEVAALLDGPAAAMQHAVAQGLLAHDAGALAEAARMPAAAQHRLFAAEALSHALRLHHKRADSSGKAAVLIQFRKMQFPFQATGSAAIVELAALAELTVREKEIATLVHRRHSNKEIAEQFTLSQRTVEGHLYKIYAKLGVGSREELYGLWLPELLSQAGK
ncbi:LuxR C-terminal-related transcriptional regulator [Specibacter sp. NPDC057265]|uniref:LuxR C-terminal-related transcriptional regulator n=1 Tax=Specibacter sp. NPDC057265 TaxID=3346075 RepID=UPI003639F568